MWNPLASEHANRAHEEVYAPRKRPNVARRELPVRHVDSKGWEWFEAPPPEDKGTTDWCYE